MCFNIIRRQMMCLHTLMSRPLDMQIEKVNTEESGLPIMDEIQIAAWKNCIASLEYLIKTTENI